MTKIQKIELALSKGKIGGAKALLKELLLQEDKDKFYSDMRDVYYELYPLIREATDDEKLTQYEVFEKIAEDDSSINLVDYEDFIADKVTIDYSEDENYLSFEDYKNETKVITEAIAEELDEDGNVVTEAVEEVTEPIRGYVAVDVTDRVNGYAPLVAKEAEMVQAKVQSSIDVLTATYPKFEVDTFAIQQKEMEAWYINDTAAVPFVTILADKRGITVEDMMAKIKTNAEALTQATANVIGEYQANV